MFDTNVGKSEDINQQVDEWEKRVKGEKVELRFESLEKSYEFSNELITAQITREKHWDRE